MFCIFWNRILFLKVLSDILRQRTKDTEVKKYCVSLLEKFGSFKYTKQVLGKLKEEARDVVSRLGVNPYMDDVLETVFKTEWLSQERTFQIIF